MVIPPALRAIYEDQHDFIVVRKPSQVGMTEFNINTALFVADTGYAGRGVALVVLPTGEMAERVSQARFAKAINDSQYLRRRARPGSGPIKAPANVQRRSIGKGLVYVVGSEQESQFAGIDADVAICDEFDLMAEDTLSLIQVRTRFSPAPRIIVTSTPTVADFGVSFLYDRRMDFAASWSVPRAAPGPSRSFPRAWTGLPRRSFVSPAGARSTLCARYAGSLNAPKCPPSGATS
jgi:phage terminase large subunit GpA-like protein